jgi:S1-C subfamily serine protease
LLLLAIAAAPAVEAQQIMRHGGGAGGDLVILEEIGAVVGLQEGADNLEVLTVLPNAPTKSDVSVKQGDLLLMVAGKRVSDIDTLREAYEGAEVGDTLKFGFRRGDERFLVSFDKEEKQQGKRIVMMGGPGQAGGDIQPLMEYGVVLTEVDGKVIVGMLIPSHDAGLVENDVIKSVNGKAIDSIAAFREIYEAIEIGGDLNLVYARDGEETSLTRARIDASGMIRMRREP